ncbi:AcvB/VirJ family lysyl-phosphatidylglycerol hydrolase [Sphingomonas sp. KR1UV-12]|uniref:AcvB/VirJ family lysyl-phosphatidylglycerol hydrolase n=1 Tax=Sphingomonas aurea TaxID=3063994 RepID=A0ABT9EI62_9SPHN|nr:AcvB/VirJ family lysyl-phosphatidylglycerol hydrolase [Sphingomonas sp. KR1UV-12]MDP1026643.1 AcvB/VirJ family lysyl-phosphatidylglycerol hydrolase [Sphingomonas sp. KR1UV-12]
MIRARIARAALVLFLTAILGAIGFGAHLGYFGGPVFTLVPARGAPPARTRGTALVFFSGDMGFNTGMGPRMVARLAGQGIPVIGVNSLTAFARRGDAATAAALVREAVERAAALPGIERVVLTGQSFGANLVLAGAASLPPALKAKVPLVELVVPARTMLFKATPGGAFDTGTDGPAMPYARQLSGTPVLCIHGEAEEDSLCPVWRQRNVQVVALPGDHYLHHDDALVAATMLRVLRAIRG